MAVDFADYRRWFLFWIWTLLVLATAWLFSRGGLKISSGDSHVGGAQAWVTSQFAMANLLSLTTLFVHGFFVTIICGLPIFRDEGIRISDILHTTPLRRREYVWAKFGAALLACFAVIGAGLLLLIFFNHAIPNSTPEIHGPLALSNYLSPFFVVAVPSFVFVAGIAFALGTWSKQPVTVFVLPIGLLVLVAVLFQTWDATEDRPTLRSILMMLDPTGRLWIRHSYLDVDRGAAFYNQATIHWSPAFLASRIALTGIGLLMVALVARKVAMTAVPVRRDGAARKEMPTQTPWTSGSTIATVGMAQSEPSTVRQALRLAALELRGLARQPGLYLFVPVVLLTIVPSAVSGKGPFDSSLLPTPGALAQRGMTGVVTFIILLLLFYTVESLERDARVRLDGLMNTTPTSSAAFLLGRILANVALGGIVMFLGWLVCLVVMTLGHSPSKSAMPFLLLWGACGLPTVVIWTSFVGMVWAKLRSRYATYGIGLLVMMGTGVLFYTDEANWLTNWGIWGSVVWSDISVLELDRTILILNRLFVLSLGALFLRLAVLFYQRVEPDPLSSLPFWKRPRLRPMLGLAPFLIPAVALGIALRWHLESGPEGHAAERQVEDYWKQNISTFRDTPNPDIRLVDLDVALDLAHGTMNVRGAYTLVNRTTSAMRHILLTTGRNMQAPTFTLHGQPYVPENRSELRVFTPPVPLAPEETTTIGFAYTARLPDGASANGGGAEDFILPSGVMLTSLSPTFVPLVGFHDSLGTHEGNVADPRLFEPDFYAGMTPAPEPFPNAPFATRIRITTPADFVANSVGTKMEDTFHDGKRTVLWESDQPVYAFNIVAGRWATFKAKDTEVYYDMRHASNVPELSLALQSAKNYYATWFSPYLYKSLRLSEFPGLATFAVSYPSNIAFSENMGFLADPKDDTNLVFYLAAHEAAHQWWPHLVMPAEGPGAPILSEGLANFSALLLVEAVKGDAARREVAKHMEDTYGKQRLADAERPLTAVNDLPSVIYDRGGWVFWMLMETMGRDEMFAGLHAYVENYRSNTDHPTLHDFFATMRPYAKDAKAFDDFIAQWFEVVTVPQFEFVSASKEARGAGFRVSGRLRNAGTGRIAVDVAASSGERFPKKSETGTKLYRERRTRVLLPPGGEADFSMEADFAPERVVVDPDVMVLQLQRQAARKQL